MTSRITQECGCVINVYSDGSAGGAEVGEWCDLHYAAPSDEWTESAENEPEPLPDGEVDLECRADKFERRDNAPLVKPRGHCVRIDNWDV